MIEQSHRRFVAIFAILILFTTAILASYHPAFATSSTGVMVPLFSYPGSYWTQVIQDKNTHPSVPIVVVINPNSGPGSSIDTNYVTGIKQLQSAGITVLGYVYTSYGARSTNSVEADINSYNNWYHVNGIAFDEMANTAGYETYYSNLSSYVKSLGMTMTVGNPGTDTLSSYIGTVDVLVIYENAGLPTISNLGGWHTSYPKSDFAFIGYGVSSLPSQSTITTDSGNVGYMYITDDVLPNPYDTVPSYLSTEVGMFDTGSTSSTAPSSPTGLAATAISSSQINLSWAVPASNGGSAITGYEIDRSANSGSTWSTVQSNTGSTSTTYSDTGLTVSTAYTYRVSAINAVGTSSPSNTASATTSSGTTATALGSPTDLATRLGGNNTGIYYPLYSLSELPQVLAAKLAFPNVPFNVNINPASGPGTAPSAAWASAITQLKGAGAVVTGYVPTGYGTGRSIANVESMVSAYNQFYPNMLDGIMFDEVSGSCSEFTFYQTISNYARSIGYSYIRANPGSSICQTDVPLFNHIAIYESAGYPSESTLASRTFYPQYSKDVVGFGSTVHTEPTYDPTWLHMATKYLKWVYITDQTEPNPYAVFPSYFNQYLTDLSSLAGNTPPIATAPSSPTGLAATAISSSQINLSWTAASNGGSAITGYEIDRSANSGSTWSTVQSNTGSTSTTYSDTGLTASTAYTYRVSAINAVGTSSPSNTASGTTSSGTTATAPQPPTGLAATAISSSQINLSWTAASNGGSAITGYEIDRSANSGSTWSTVQSNTGSTSTTYSDTGLTASTAYTYRVSAINAVGTSSPSNTATATTSSGTTSTPVTITVNSVDLSGTPITGMWTVIRTPSGTTLAQGYTPTTFTVTAGNTYVVHVGNYNTNVFNHWNGGNTTSYYTITPTQSVTLTAYYSTGTTPTATVPSAPTGLTDPSGNTQASLSWTAPANNGGSPITGYNVYRGTTSGGESSTPIATGITSTTYTDTGLTNGQTYYYTVAAVNSVGISPPSNEASATPLAPATAPGSPTGLAATAGNTQASLSWTAPANNGGSSVTNYKIYRSTSSGTETLLTTVGNVNSYTDTGLTNGVTYYFTVTAVNSVGESTPSNEANAMPAAPATAPGSPTGLAATAISSSQINLSWTAASNGGSAITGYEIDRSANSGSTWSTVQSNTGSTSTTYSDTGLTASTAYTYRVSAINAVGTSSPSNTASGTTSSGTTSTPVTITVNSVKLSGTSFTGMWVELHASNGTILATGYTPATFTVTPGVQYTVYAANYQSTIFNHWSNGSTNSSITITPTQNTALVAYYSTPVTITVNSVKLSGTSFTGMWVELHASNGTILATGYTPATFTVTPGVQYTVYAANYQSTIFNHWSNGSTNSSITITPTQNTALVAYYSTPVTITVNSVDLSGTPITGMWTVIRTPSGTTLAQGYTPTTFTVTAGNTYVVHVGNYNTNVFNHWNGGNTTSYYTITPTQSVTLTAYYSTG